MTILVTGSAGFIGFHLARRLLGAGERVIGFDRLTQYYDVELKRAREAILGTFSAFETVTADLADADAVEACFRKARPRIVFHLAAQAGVRYSITHPDAYVSANLVGTYNVLEACRRHRVRHLLAASTSSVYGGNARMPFSEQHPADMPLTLYAATKKACEGMAHAYAHLFDIPISMLRFFTVYGPWGRPDMALFKFTKAILAGEEIEVYNNGDMTRDFTYIDDLIAALETLADRAPVVGEPVGPHDTLSPVAPFRVVNMGGGSPVRLARFVDLVERACGVPARRRLLPMQEGDVPHTSSSTALLRSLAGSLPSTPVEVGVPRFVDWYRTHYRDDDLSRARASAAPRETA